MISNTNGAPAPNSFPREADFQRLLTACGGKVPRKTVLDGMLTDDQRALRALHGEREAWDSTVAEQHTGLPRGDQAGQSGSSPPSAGVVDKALVVNPATALDCITVLRTIGPLATKKWLPDGSVKGYDNAALFTVSTRPINTLFDLAAVLREIEGDAQALVIRGRLREDAAEIQRANLPARNDKRAKEGKPPLAPREGQFARLAEHFEDVAHRWMMLDVDGYRPSVDPVVNPEAAISEFITTALPAEFRHASFYWQLSSSAGHAKHAGVLKAHLWFWLREPATGPQVKAWASANALPVDLSVFGAVQAHYTAAPVFADGVADPVPKRSGYFDSIVGDDVVLVLPEVKPQRTYGRVPQDANAQPLTERQIAEFTSALAVLDPDDRGEWISVILNCNKWPELYEPVRAWSATSKLHSDDEFAAKWEEDGNGHWKTVLAKAPKRGWVNPARGRYSAPTIDGLENLGPDEEPQQLPTAAELIDQLRGEPRERVIETWAARAAHLPRTECEDVITEVERLTSIGPRKLAGALNEARQAAAKMRARREFERKRAGREVIEVERGEVGAMSRLVASAIVGRLTPGECMVFGDRVVCVRVEQLPSTHLIDDGDGEAPPVPQFKPFNDPLMRTTIERTAIFMSYDAKGQPRRDDVPDKVVAHMVSNPPEGLPRVSGLLSHPVVMPNGEIVAEDGLHARTGLYLHGAHVEGLRPYTQGEAAAALARLRAGLFSEFEFASELDADVALAALLTAVNRRVMQAAPGVAILASRQSSGKTTLARMIHVAITGHDMPVTTISESSEELKKHLFAMLLRSPEMVCIDNVADGFTFRSPTLAAMMTSGTHEDRRLGATENVRVQTQTFWAITGNNVQLGSDEVTRWLVCRLEPSMARPEERRFKNADVVQHVRRQREQILRDVIGIVCGFVASGDRVNADGGARFPEWERLVRLPLIWAGASDVVQVFATNRELSPDESAKAGLLSSLLDLSGGGEFTAIDVVDWLRGVMPNVDLSTPSSDSWSDALRRLRGALAETRMKNSDSPSAPSIGRVLGGLENAATATSVGVLRLRRYRTRDVTIWQVVPG